MIYNENFIQGNISKNVLIKPIGVILHHTGDYSKQSIINTFTTRESSASAHVCIWKDGSRTIFAEDTQRAWHAGNSEFNGMKYCNNFMLGVEFQGDTNKQPLKYAQIDSFIEWLAPRFDRWLFEKQNIVDHKFVSPGRKVDLNNKELKRILNAIKYFWL